MVAEITLLIAFVYAIIESLEKLGLNRKSAHLLAIPFGILCSFGLLQCTSVKEYLMKGIFIGLGANGTCDTACNIIDNVKRIGK